MKKNNTKKPAAKSKSSKTIEIHFEPLPTRDKKNNFIKYKYKTIRESTNLSQQKIADIMNITKATYCKMENYKLNPRLETFIKYYNSILIPIGLTPDNVFIPIHNPKAK